MEFISIFKRVQWKLGVIKQQFRHHGNVEENGAGDARKRPTVELQLQLRDEYMDAKLKSRDQNLEDALKQRDEEWKKEIEENDAMWREELRVRD